MRGESVLVCQCETDLERERDMRRQRQKEREKERKRERDRSPGSHYQLSAAWPGWDCFSELWSVTSLDLSLGVCVSALTVDSNTIRWLLMWRKTENAHTHKKKICDTTGPFGQLTHQWIKHLKSISLGAFIQNPEEGVQGVLEKLLEKYKTGFHFLNLNFKYILIETKQWHFILNSELYCTI